MDQHAYEKYMTDCKNESQEHALVSQILNAIRSQKFFDWYNTGNWDKYISGDDDAPSYPDIVKDIKSLFKIAD